MRKSIAATTVAACVALGGMTGAVLGVPAMAGAAETATGAAGWVRDSLTGLVDDGTITQEQADAVATALEEARPARGFGHRFGAHLGLDVVAGALDMTVEELREATADGRTIAEVAGDEGVEVDTVVDAIVAAQKEKADERVAAGDITQAQADEFLAGAEERATALVNGELREFRGFRGGPRRGFRGSAS